VEGGALVGRAVRFRPKSQTGSCLLPRWYCEGQLLCLLPCEACICRAAAQPSGGPWLAPG
jgi:hypothetical protein